MRRAAGVFGVVCESLTYRVLDRGNPCAVGLRGSDARVLADLPQEQDAGERYGPLDRIEERAPEFRRDRSPRWSAG